jgi:hypothetical protein
VQIGRPIADTRSGTLCQRVTVTDDDSLGRLKQMIYGGLLVFTTVADNFKTILYYATAINCETELLEQVRGWWAGYRGQAIVGRWAGYRGQVGMLPWAGEQATVGRWAGYRGQVWLWPD